MYPTNPNQFTEKAWDAVVRTPGIAKQAQQQLLESQHLMRSLLEQEGLASTIFHKLGVNVQQMRDRIDEFIRRQPKVSGSVTSDYLGPSFDTLLDRAEDLRKQYDNDFISIEHLLLAFKDDLFGKVLYQEFKVDAAALKTTVDQICRSQKVTDQNPEGKYETLEKYGRDLTELARQGKLDPVIGREDEIRRIIEILSWRTKSNPVLIGEPGVGKTAIAEGLAQRIINHDVPNFLRNYSLVSLDMGSLIIDDKKLKFLREVTHLDRKVILFIDDLHTIIDEGAMDVSTSLKLMLVRGKLLCIAATTPKEYRKLVKKDPALEYRFQPIQVEEPTVEDTISILRRLKEQYEVHHNLRITDSALVEAATLSNCQIRGRFLPRKAINLVDEAAARLIIELTFKPIEFDKIDRKILLLEFERLSLQREKDPALPEKLTELERKLASLKEEKAQFCARWQSEKEVFDKICTLKKTIDQVRLEINQAERGYDINRAAELKYGDEIRLQNDLKTQENLLLEIQSQGSALIRQEVTKTDIAKIVAESAVRLVNCAKENLNFTEVEQQHVSQAEALLAREQQRTARLVERLRQMGIDPDVEEPV